MRKSLGILALIMVILIVQFQAAATQGASPAAPDMAQTALNLMAVECQKLNDFAIQASQNNLNGFESVQTQFNVSISNFDYLIGGFIPELIAEFKTVANNLNPTVESVQAAAAACQSLRTRTYEKMLQYPDIFNSNAPITDFNSCTEAGYFVSGDTCFIGGNFVFDQKGFLIGLYDADCYEGGIFYQGSCWYCEYGNNENGCKESTAYGF
jgi:hypothetical protein